VDVAADATVRDYLARTVRAWLGLPAASQWTPPPLPDPLARLVLRVEEYERPHRDRWDCWEFGQSENHRRGALWTAEVDRWLAERRAEAAQHAELVPLWPEAQPFAICLTHDVDFVSAESTPAQVVRSLRAAASGTGPLRFVRPAVRLARAAVHGVRRTPSALDALQRCVDLEREYGVTGSYFFTVFPDEHVDRVDCLYLPGDRCRFDGRSTTVGQVMRTLLAEGFDVGLHGSYHSALVPGMLARQKAVLEQALGSAIRTTRQHFLHWDVRMTPALQEQAGLAADSTLGFNRNVGYRAGTSLPFRHFDLEQGRELRLLQVPMILHDGPLFRPDGLELDVETAVDVSLQLVREAEETGGLVTLLFHPNSLARDDFRAVYRAVLDRARERGAWIASLRDVVGWWDEREARLSAS